MSDFRDLVRKIHDSPPQAVLAVAGAGSEAVAWLLGVAGASRTLLEVLVPYGSLSMIDFIGHEPSQFVSVETATDMARAAYNRALLMRESPVPVLGLGCTATIATVAATTEFSAGDLGGRPHEARRHFVGDNLNLRATLALLVLPGAVIKPAVHDHALSLGDRLGDVLGQAAPTGDVEEGDHLFAVLVLTVPGQAEAGHRGAAWGEPQFRVPGHIAYNGHGVVVCHFNTPFRQPAVAGSPSPSRPRRSTSESGRRMILWRTTSLRSASRRFRSVVARSLASVTTSRTT